MQVKEHIQTITLASNKSQGKANISKILEDQHDRLAKYWDERNSEWVSK